MNVLQRFVHNVLGWHNGNHKYVWSIGQQWFTDYRCSVCGRRVLLDSQGNWFDVPERQLADIKK